jgi:hypothetical protein
LKGWLRIVKGDCGAASAPRCENSDGPRDGQAPTEPGHRKRWGLDGGVESTRKRFSNSVWGSMEHLEEKIEAHWGLWTMSEPILGKSRDTVGLTRGAWRHRICTIK